MPPATQRHLRLDHSRGCGIGLLRLKNLLQGRWSLFTGKAMGYSEVRRLKMAKKAGRASWVVPPVLQDVAKLTPLRGDVVVADEEYSECAFVGDDWQRKSASGICFDTAIFENATLSGTRLRDVALSDVRITGSDMANADWSGGGFRQVEIVSTRLTGFVGSESDYENVLFSQCKANYAVMQLSRIIQCRFEGCDLTEATFEGATLKRIVFRNCDLTGTRFMHANLDEIDLRGSRIDRIEIMAEDLKQLRIDITQTPVIARLAGAKIDDDASHH